VIAQQEIFGPVLTVIPADGEADAIAKANDSIYGLNAPVLTHDVDRAYAVARRLRTGTVGHNGTRTDATIASGGFKQSAIGREGGIEGLRPYLESTTVLLDQYPRHLGQVVSFVSSWIRPRRRLRCGGRSERADILTVRAVLPGRRARRMRWFPWFLAIPPSARCPAGAQADGRRTSA
jgi:Aldehyde dehydrogenase family